MRCEWCKEHTKTYLIYFDMIGEHLCARCWIMGRLLPKARSMWR